MMTMEDLTAKDAKDRKGDRENALSKVILDAGFKIHSALGPGLLESAYEACLEHEIAKSGLLIQRQLLLPIRYDGVILDAGYRLDLLVDRCVVVELKAVDRLLPLHEAQILSHLRLGGFRLGLLLNFNVLHFKDGIRRIANGM
jgi:GxxExxY protein